MRSVIGIDLDTCVGCNYCIRVCPVEEANVAYVDDNDTIKVRVDTTKCIACGACLHICSHKSRTFDDDTERFFADLRSGAPISLFCAPASRASLKEWDKILALLHQMGVRKIYDVSLGADICTWAHIRYIQKHNPSSIITQPCPAIVDYILMHRNDLIPSLSPVHSPMLCTAIYMKKYCGVTDRIAAISPCIAKSYEFEQTGGLVSYNVTFLKLEEYIKRNNLRLPAQGRGYDHIDSSLGSIYSMPGGLKENVEFMIGKVLRIDKSEGTSVVYKALDAFSVEDKANLPAVFDVLNCAEGCNLGTGCRHDKSLFEVNVAMEKARMNATKERDRDYFEQLYQEYDDKLKLDDFIRHYRALPVRSISVSQHDIEAAFDQLSKHDEISRSFNCGACGAENCATMARKIAKKVNIPENCLKKAHDVMNMSHKAIMAWQQDNFRAIKAASADITQIRATSDSVVDNVSNIDILINNYDALVKDINKIASNIHMISLNASIEAARAGQAGRGFAVVAEAIRGLATETQKATSKISEVTQEAKQTLGGISSMVVGMGGNIARAEKDINKIEHRTTLLLSQGLGQPDSRSKPA